MAKDDYYWEMTPRELAGLFMTKNWKYHYTPIAVLDKHLISTVENLVKMLKRTGSHYAENGRFVVYRDAEFPNGYEIMLKVGYVNTDVPEDMDTPQ